MIGSELSPFSLAATLSRSAHGQMLGETTGDLPPLSPNDDSGLVHLSIDIPSGVDRDHYQVSERLCTPQGCLRLTESNDKDYSRDDLAPRILLAFTCLFEDHTEVYYDQLICQRASLPGLSLLWQGVAAIWTYLFGESKDGGYTEHPDARTTSSKYRSLTRQSTRSQGSTNSKETHW